MSIYFPYIFTLIKLSYFVLTMGYILSWLFYQQSCLARLDLHLIYILVIIQKMSSNLPSVIHVKIISKNWFRIYSKAPTTYGRIIQGTKFDYRKLRLSSKLFIIKHFDKLIWSDSDSANRITFGTTEKCQIFVYEILV